MQLEIDLQAALGRIEALESDVIALQSLTQFFSVDNSTLNGLTGPHLLITGSECGNSQWVRKYGRWW